MGLMCGKELNHYHTIPTFKNPELKVLKTKWDNGENAGTSIFSLSPNVLYPITDKTLISQFEQDSVCALLIMLLIWTSLTFCYFCKEVNKQTTLFQVCAFTTRSCV